MATTPIIAPDGSVADVPNEHVDALIAKGGKVGVDMLSPDGKERATVPQEHAQDLLKKGASFAPPAGTPGMPQPKVEPMDASLGGVVKDEAKAALAHPGQAALGAVNEVGSLARSTMPQTGTLTPQDAGLPSAPPKDQSGAVAKAYNTASQLFGKVAHPPQTTAESAGAHATDVAAVAANAPAVIRGAVSVARAGKDVVKNAFTVSPEVKAAANAEIPADLQKTATATSNQIKQPVAEKLNSALHDALDQTAKEHGVTIEDTPSASTKADRVGRKVLDKAQVIYKQLDEVSGGRYQRFRDSLDELSDIVRNSKYLNPEAAADAKVQLQEATDRYAALQRRMIKQGVDPNLIKQADSLHNQGRSLLDVSSKLKGAEDLSGTVKANAVNSVDTSLKNLRKTPAEAARRLDAAVGPERANDIRQALAESQQDIQKGVQAKADAQASVKNLEESRRTAQKEVDRVARNRMRLVKTGAATVGIAGAGKAFEMLKGPNR